MTTSLTCPKCGSAMRSYERNRVLVDQCTGCGGLFLDRGELEALVAAETAWNQSAPPAPQQPMAQQSPAPQPGIQDGRGYQQPPVQAYGQAPYRTYSKAPRYATSKGYYGHRRRRSFLSELFDD
ncbi:MAG: zf-TFIIB domain-containing protein [Tetrasphaera jenkinsii]|jgi:Zn-finger nucleic acid-binding protein|nr:zf-TFIIB domain-containing protein [Tetrasphaera jenkinsii]MCI1261901.1 zf-TFIIB domain-containing protein [Tetrasphaera jenkinsii]